MNEQQPATKNNKSIIILVIIVVVAVLGFGVYYFFTKDTVDTNSNLNTVANVNANQNTNTSLPAGTKTCNYDTDCKVKYDCEEIDCYHKDAPPEYKCDPTLMDIPDLSNYFCVCAERECTLVEESDTANSNANQNTNTVTNQNTNQAVNANTNQSANANQNANTNQAAVDITNWLTYTNSVYEYSIRYPSGYFSKDIGPTDMFTHFANNEEAEELLEVGTDGIWLTFRVDLNNSNTSLEEYATVMPYNTNGIIMEKIDTKIDGVQAIKQLEKLTMRTPSGWAWVTYLSSGDYIYSIRAWSPYDVTLNNFKTQYDAMVDSFRFLD